MFGQEDAIRIGVDARSIFMPRPRGTGRNLLDAYRLIPRLRPHWRFVLYHQREWSDCIDSAGCDDESLRELTDLGNLETRRIDMAGDRFDAWFQMRLPAAARADRIDLLHFPANSAPAWRSTPSVVTVHDLIPLRVDGECAAAQQRKFVRGLRRAVRGATRIIAVSHATRDDLHDEFSVPLEKISVVPWAPDSRIASRACPQATNSAGQKYDLRRGWLIGFSGASRRKNAPALIEAMAGLSPDQRNDLDLVLVGCEPASFRDRLEDTARRAGVAEHCRFMGFVPPDDIAGLLGGARGLVMPSLYEGFGLPILDAFALGVPVVTSDTSSMPEVAGEAALYCNPHDPPSITRAIERLLDRRTAARLVRAGRERVARFTWERTAEAMCEVYERCLCESSRRRPATSGVGVAGLVEECIE